MRHHSSDPAGMRRWAVLVGINHYGEAFPALRSPVNDAAELKSALTAWPGSGYTAESVRLLVGDARDRAAASRESMLLALDDLAGNAGPEDLLLFYFAGYAEVVGTDDILLLPSDARAGRLLAHTALSLAEVKRLLADSPACGKIIILDVSYTGISTLADPRYDLPADPESWAYATEIIRRLAEHTTGLAILHAGARNDPVVQIGELEHSPFTGSLLQVLREYSDTNRDEAITVRELHDYAGFHIDAWAAGIEGSVPPPVHDLAGSGDLTIINVPKGAGAEVAKAPESGASQLMLPGDALLVPLRDRNGFVGRKEELRRITHMLANTADTALLVKGEPGVGKTSFINQVKTLLDENNLGERRFRHFSIEPAGIVSVQDFAREIWYGVLRCADVPSMAERSSILDTFGGFGDSLEQIRVLAADTTFVVFLDEFDSIRQNCTELELTRIRGLINYLVVSTNFPIVFFFSVLQDLPPHYGSAVPTLPLVLHILTRAETEEMVRSILAGYLVPGDADIAWLYEHSGGHPFLARLLLAELLNQSPRRNPSRDMWARAVHAALESGRASGLFGNLYESYLTDDQRYIFLWLAATHASTISEDRVARLGARLRTALRELVQRDYFVDEPGGGYRLRISLLCDWLARWPRFQLEAERLGVLPESSVKGDGGFGAAPQQIPKEGICVDLRTQRVYVEGQETPEELTDQQYRALLYLIEHVERVVSKDELAEHVWPDEAYEVDDQRIAQIIHRLREALGDRQKPFRYLETRPKRGYRMRQAQIIRTGIL